MDPCISWTRSSGEITFAFAAQLLRAEDDDAALEGWVEVDGALDFDLDDVAMDADFLEGSEDGAVDRRGWHS